MSVTLFSLSGAGDAGKLGTNESIVIFRPPNLALSSLLKVKISFKFKEVDQRVALYIKHKRIAINIELRNCRKYSRKYRRKYNKQVDVCFNSKMDSEMRR